MPETDQKKFEKDSIRDVLIIGIVGITIFLLLVIYGFKMILEYNGLL